MRTWLLVVMLALLPAASNAQPAPSPPAQPGTHDGHGGHSAPVVPTRPSGDAQGARPEQEDAPLPPFIPVLTDADREAAFPRLGGHAVHDQSINTFVLFDQLEWQTGGGEGVLNVDSKGWIGQDVNRLWFRGEGEGEGGDLEHAEAHILYGRAVARWWDVVAGVRQDVGPGPNRTWAAVGVQGLAPYWFEVEATAYLGAEGRTHVRLETEYELLITNRLVLQPLAEVEIYGKSDPERGIGAGLSSADFGLRVRYEFKREFAPYVGVTWNHKFFDTADYAREDGDSVRSTRLALGVRLWF
ncbi:copper resistance protein B [Luteitalea sp.]|uniref:copper resistance protein B n=1 Tax=Luteitalea sp. TaxID=2004800 RepID=UPI0025B9D6B2|nr:copper resistance protein B [Luteitalea sp.]